MTNQQVVDTLLDIRDKWLTSGDYMKRNFTTPEGVTIFFKDLPDVENQITHYRNLVNLENGVSSLVSWVDIYV